MSTKSLLELEARLVRSLRTYGISLVVAGALSGFLVPGFGITLGVVLGVIGVITLVQAFRKGRDVQRRLDAADELRVTS